MAINEGDIVYIRARATKRAVVYNHGVSEDGVVVSPMARDQTEFDYIVVPPESVISAEAAEWAIRKRIEREQG